MVLGSLGCMNNADFEKRIVNDILHIVYIFDFRECIHFDAILCRCRSYLKTLSMVRFSSPVSVCNSNCVYPILHDV